MMWSTHILMGAVLSLWTVIFAHEYVMAAVLSGMIAGVVPDLDMLFQHRKTLHRPFQYAILTALSGVLLFLQPSLWTVVVFCGLVSITSHSFAEIFSSGATVEPFLKTDDRAVYNHLTDEWIKPRRIILTGSFRDLLLTLALGSVLIYFIEANLLYLTSSILVYGVIHFAILNKTVEEWMPEGYDHILDALENKIAPDAAKH